MTRLRLLEEHRDRRRQAPLAYSRLWHSAQTSQRTALLPLVVAGILMLAIVGGNRTGKSELAIQYAVACAAGRDAYVDTPRGRFYWVREWLRTNELPEELIPLGPGRVWVGSPTYGSAVEQIRPKLKTWCPDGTEFRSWDSKTAEAEAQLPNGGAVVSKAYSAYDANPQSWEGANVRACVLDEQPNSRENLTAAMSRLIDQRGQLIIALTHLRGKQDWFYKDLLAKGETWLAIQRLWGEDNPWIPQDRRAMFIASVPAWQRASRDRGETTSPEGRIYPWFDRATHVVDRFPVPPDWRRWVGIDWGGRTAHIVWAAEAPTGKLYVYRELAIRRSTVEPACSDQQLVAEARRLEADAGEAHLGYDRVADCESPGAIEEAWEQGYLCTPIEKFDGSVKFGIELVDAMLCTADPVSFATRIEPRIYLLRGAAPVLEEELECYVWADTREGQKPKPSAGCSDHGCDALRYLVQYRDMMGGR